MGRLARILEPQASGGDITTSAELDAFLRVYGGHGTYAGVSITPEQALRVSAVFACVKVLSETLAQLPLMLYRRLPEGGRERAVDHRLFDLLHNRPNPWQTSFEWREMQQGHLALRGNAFSFINRVGGRVVELLPLQPDRVEVKQNDDLSITYKVHRKVGAPEAFGSREILHIPGLSLNGVVGLSPIAAAREAIGLAAATEKFGAQLFRNGAKMSGILKHPTAFKDPEVAERVRKSWDEATSGESAHRTALLEDGLDWMAVSMSADDAQFILTREHQIPEVARYYRMPLHKIQSMKQATFSNIEHQAIEFVTDTMMPWITRWEQRLSMQLLTSAERREFFVAFLVDGLLRGDIKSRNQALEIERRNGIISANEWRKTTDRNPRTDPGGDEYWQPLNIGDSNGKEKEPSDA